MKLFFIFLLTIISPFAYSEEGFKASIEVVPQTLSILDSFTVNFDLEHPKGYMVDINILRMNLTSYAGFGPTPFLIESEKITAGDTFSNIQFTFNPQIAGKHLLVPGNLIFRKEKEQHILPTDILEILVSSPIVTTFYSGNPLPIISIDQLEPIILSEANREGVRYDKAEFNEPMKIIETRERILYSLFYLFIFALIVFFTALIPRHSAL